MDWKNLGEILEMVMIVCFGISWPLSVYKSYKARTAEGKSFVFLFAIWFGYVAGICGKIMQENMRENFVARSKSKNLLKNLPGGCSRRSFCMLQASKASHF